MRKTIGGLLFGLICLVLTPAVPSASFQACAQGQCPPQWENWETGAECDFTGTTVEHAGIEFCAYDCDGTLVYVHGA